MSIALCLNWHNAAVFCHLAVVVPLFSTIYPCIYGFSSVLYISWGWMEGSLLIDLDYPSPIHPRCSSSQSAAFNNMIFCAVNMPGGKPI